MAGASVASAQTVERVDAFRDALVVTWSAGGGTESGAVARSFHVVSASDLVLYPSSEAGAVGMARMERKDWFPEGGADAWAAWQSGMEEARLAFDLKQAQGDLVEDDLALLRANRKVGGTSEALLVEDLEAVAQWMHEEIKDLLYRRVELRNEIADKQADIDRLEELRDMAAPRTAMEWSVPGSGADGPFITTVVERSAGQGWRPSDLLALDGSGRQPRIVWHRRAELSLDLPIDGETVPIRFHDALHAGLADRPDARPRPVQEYGFKSDVYTDALRSDAAGTSPWPGTSWLAESVPVGPDVHLIVPLGNIELPVVVRHFAVPRQSPVVNMRLTLPRPSVPVAEAERAEFTMDGRPAGRVWLSERGDSLVVDAGAVHDWTVERQREVALCSKSNLGNRIKHHRAYMLTVTNRSGQDGEIVIEEPLPISRDAEIEVLPDSTGGGELDEASGIITWRLALNAGESRTVRFSFDLSHARDQQVPDFD